MEGSDEPLIASEQPATQTNPVDEIPVAEEMIADLRMIEGAYDRIIPELGLTAENAMIFESLGVEQQTISTLRSLFTSLDKDGGYATILLMHSRELAVRRSPVHLTDWVYVCSLLQG